MPKAEYYWESAAKCPFFGSESVKRHRIICNEGPVSDTSVSLTFSGKDYKRRSYMRTYCCDAYEKCDIYAVCARKWE